MNTFILILIVIAYLMISLTVTNNDLVFPTNIVMVMYMLSLTFFISEMRNWDGDISSQTLFLFIVGLTTYLITSIIVFKVFSRISIFKRERQYNFTELSDAELKEGVPNVDGLLTLAIDIYLVFALLKYYLDVRSASMRVGVSSSFSGMIGNYRNAGAYGEGKVDVSLSTLSTYNFMLMTALGYVYMALVVQYLVLKKKTSLQWKVLNSIPITVYALATILTGGRNPLIQFIVAFAVMYYLKHVQIYGKVKFDFKKILRLFFIGVFALWGFSEFRTVVGRSDTKSTWDYLAMYIGASIKLFDKFVTDPVRISHQYIGQETFPYLWISFFGKTITNWSNLEFRNSSSGINLGNVYTAFRRYYSDFGVGGLITLTALESFFYSLFYVKVSDKRKPSKEIDFATLLYSFFAVGPVYYSVDDRLFPYYVAKDRLYIIILMFVFAKVLSHVKLGFQVTTKKL